MNDKVIRKTLSPEDTIHEKFRPIKVIDAALSYLEEPKKRRKWTPTITIGPKTLITKKVISKLKLPPLPLMISNKELRENMKDREESPLYKIAAFAISEKFNSIKKEIKTAIKEENAKEMSPQILYRLEPESEKDEPILEKIIEE